MDSDEDIERIRELALAMNRIGMAENADTNHFISALCLTLCSIITSTNQSEAEARQVLDSCYERMKDILGDLHDGRLS